MTPSRRLTSWCVVVVAVCLPVAVAVWCRVGGCFDHSALDDSKQVEQYFDLPRNSIDIVNIPHVVNGTRKLPALPLSTCTFTMCVRRVVHAALRCHLQVRLAEPSPTRDCSHTGTKVAKSC